MFISAIVMVLLLSFLPLHPALLSDVTMGNYRRIQLAKLNVLLLVAALETVLVGVGGGHLLFVVCGEVIMTSMKIQFKFHFSKRNSFTFNLAERRNWKRGTSKPGPVQR